MPPIARPGSATRRIALAPIPFLLILVLGGAMAGCSGDHSGAASGDAVATHATMSPEQGTGDMVAAPGDGLPTPEQINAMWAARPSFVSGASERTQAGYAFAISRPDIVQWLPCYCGCGAMGHMSNLDCFVKPTEGAAVVFEEHGSYCDICVDTALMAQDMLAKGSTLIQMRAAVDAAFGGLAPGTPTGLPPA